MKPIVIIPALNPDKKQVPILLDSSLAFFAQLQRKLAPHVY